jgi:hypothetical protein
MKSLISLRVLIAVAVVVGVANVANAFDHSFAPQIRFFRAGIGALALTI